MKRINLDLPIKVLGHGIATPKTWISVTEMIRPSGRFDGKSEEELIRFVKSISQKFRIEGHYTADGNESSLTLAHEAFSKALNGLAPEAFVHGTTTTTRYTGSQATEILGLCNLSAPAWETKAGCSTSLATLHLGLGLLKMGYSSVMVTTSETMSKVSDPANLETKVGLGDAGVSLFLEENSTAPDFIVRDAIYSTDGRHIDLYTTPGKLPPSDQDIIEGKFYLTGDGDKMKSIALERYREMCESINRSDIQHFIPHQVNFAIARTIHETYFPNAKLYWDADHYGNIGGSSILLSLVKAFETGSFQKGERIALMSVGGGLSFATQIWERC